MSGVGSTNAMKKGSANNPFLAFSEVDMASYLNSAYTGCIVKYSGEAINREVSDTNKTVGEYAQNIVFNLQKDGRFGMTAPQAIKIDITNNGSSTTQYIYDAYVKDNKAYPTQITGSVPMLVLAASMDAGADVVAILCDGSGVWQKSAVNDQGKVTLWAYSEDVLFTVVPSAAGSIDTFKQFFTIVPYIVGELYKVVYGNGQYYYEEFYYISEERTTGDSDYLAPGKTMYDFTGSLQTGNGSKVNPYIANTVDEMNSYLTTAYRGAFIKYVGDSTSDYTKNAIYQVLDDGDTTRYAILPTLENEGTASDLASGKQLINSQGAIVTGTKSDTPVAATGDYFVKVIDYDGTVLLDTRGDNGDSFDLPAAPSHEGLVFQEWSASCPIVDGKVTIDNNNIMAGAVYTTASGKNEFDITLTKVTGLSVNLKLNQATTWENNVWDRTQTHTFTEYGDYTITNNGTTITTIPGGIFGQTTSNNNFFAKKARISNRISSITGEAFKSCCSLRYITLSNNITSIASDSFSFCYNLNTVILPTNVSSIANAAFNGCMALENIVLPQNITAIPNSCFMSCYKMENIALPSDITTIDNYAFDGCANIKEIVFPADITRIGTSAFYDCYAITKYDFSQCSTIPTLGGTNAFTNINKICKIIVPDSLYDEWIAATNWSTYAGYIYKASEVA